MSINYSILALLVDENVRTVGVKFFADTAEAIVKGREYTYKTTHTFEKGDLAVVFVGQQPKIVEAQRMDVPTDDRIQYKWIVCPVNLDTYLANIAIEETMASTIRKLEHDAKRKLVLDALGATEVVKGLTFEK